MNEIVFLCIEFLRDFSNPHSIWKLSDVDRDDHLSFEEYSIARFLVEEVKKGRVLPKELPSFLLPGWTDDYVLTNQSLWIANQCKMQL